MNKFCLLAVVIIIFLTGCSLGNFTSIFRSSTVNEKGFFLDAKQRIVYSKEEKRPTPDQIKMLCAEPSPDVLSAIAAKINTDYGEKNLGAAVGESVSQISRIATTELIREWLYRSCEAYFNDAIDDYQDVQANFMLTGSSLLALDHLGASLSCRPVIRAYAGVAIENEEEDDDPSSTDNEEKEDKTKGLSGHTVVQNDLCLHSNSASVKSVTDAMENIIDKVYLYSTRLNERTADKCIIKGNIRSSDSTKVYYLPNDRYYKATKVSRKGEKWFCTQEEAQSEGFRPYCDGDTVYVYFEKVSGNSNKKYYFDIDEPKLKELYDSLKKEAAGTSEGISGEGDTKFKNRRWECEEPKEEYDLYSASSN